jgi:hypothetical protein
MRALTLPCAAARLVACGSPASPDDAGGHPDSAGADGSVPDAGDGATSDAGSPTLSFKWNAIIAAICNGNDPLETCPVTAEVFVSSPSTLPDPVVTVNGQPAPVTGGFMYVARMSGPLQPTYTIVITVGSETLTRTLTSPGDYTLTLMPTTPAPNTEATLTWAPANDPAVQWAAEFVRGPSSPYNGHGNDTGMASFPADSFPAPGDYVLDFNRREFLADAPGVMGTSPNVQLAREFTIHVQ